MTDIDNRIKQINREYKRAMVGVFVIWIAGVIVVSWFVVYVAWPVVTAFLRANGVKGL